MAEPDPQLVERVAVAIHDANCPDRSCTLTVIGSVYGKAGRSVVEALADRLLSPDVEVREEWRVLGVLQYFRTLADAQSNHKHNRAAIPGRPIEHRTVRELSDGSTLVGRWRVVEA